MIEQLLATLDTILPWINQYGALALFFLLMLGIIALPIPDEPLLIASGVLIAKGNMQAVPTIIAAIAGAWAGITVSYLLGFYLGHYILTYILTSQFFKRIGIKNAHFEKAQHWFSRIGKWSLLVGYFIPGIRHFTGYTAGTLNFPYPRFALFAYTGGAIWSSLFLTTGYTLYQKGDVILHYLNQVKVFFHYGVQHLSYLGDTIIRLFS